jgi:transcriptional regulator with XRE-family HTH domain
MSVSQQVRSKTRGRTAVVEKTPREKLRDIRVRAGYSAEKVAKTLNYASTSGYSRYEQEKVQGDELIPSDIIRRLIPLFRGAGSPPVTAEELLAISDLSVGLAKPVVQAFNTAAVVEDGEGLIVVRYTVKPKTYIDAEDRPSSQGASRIGVSPMFRTDMQFAVVLNAPTGAYTPGSQLHCVDPSQVSEAVLTGAEVVVAVPYKDSGLAEVSVGRVSMIRNGEPVINDLGGVPIDGTILGVVIGAYVKKI